jgi:hypothetical protein
MTQHSITASTQQASFLGMFEELDRSASVVRENLA